MKSESAALKVEQERHYISDELALGQRLNHAIQSNHRADFGYLLALLSDNALEQSSEILKRADPEKPAWQPPFAYARATPLAAEAADYAYVPGKTFQNNIQDWRLRYAMRPEALNPVNDPAYISPEVFSNCSHFVQDRLRGCVNTAKTGTESDLLDVLGNVHEIEREVA